MENPKSRVTIHMAASLDGYVARKDGSVDWMETSDEFAGGHTMEPEFVEAFLKSIDCYVMGSRTYETALGFEAKGFGWAYGDKPTFVLTTRDLPRAPRVRRVLLGRSCALSQRPSPAHVPTHLVRGGAARFRASACVSVWPTRSPFRSCRS
jgi:dihydrofolate reductase